jgi:hypothetical protein
MLTTTARREGFQTNPGRDALMRKLDISYTGYGITRAIQCAPTMLLAYAAHQALVQPAS